ncbi:uncharacterized protein METZ01_LOCUS107514, partial [marine metagenome]
MLKLIKLSIGISTALVIVLSQQIVIAQPLIEEILVTARQREESLRDVPASITVLTDSQLER